MPLQKQTLDISFAQGLDTKTDPFRMPVGRFFSLKNSVFTKTGLLSKRNGFGSLPDLPDNNSSFLTTFNGDLTAIGEELYAFNDGGGTWVNKGAIQPLRLSTLALIRNNLNQSQADSAVSSNGLVCTAYTESNGTTTSYKYAVADAGTGQNLIAPTALVGTAGSVTGSPRVFALGNYFIIVISVTITAVEHLQYVAININTLEVIAASDLTNDYASTSRLSFDGVVANNSLFLAWDAGPGNGIEMTSVDSTLLQHGVSTIDASHQATIMSVCADTTGNTPVIWAVYYDSATGDAFAAAVNTQLDEVLAATEFFNSTGTILNLASAAQDGIVSIFYELENAYSYSASTYTNYIASRTCTEAGVLTSQATIVRSVGLGSKAFIIDENIYFLAAYQSSYQPTYFLIKSTGEIAAKLAYSNGGGYLATGLPSVSVYENVANVAYLFKDLITPVNKGTAVPSGNQVAGVYSQTGINLGSFDLSTEALSTAETGKDLFLSGGFLYMYDGYLPVEHGFFLWPDVISAGVTILADPTKLSDTTNGNPVITVANNTNLVVGMGVSGTGIAANTTISAINGTSITLSANATATGSGVTLTFSGSLSAQAYYYAVTYEWTDNQGNAFRSAPSIPQTVTASAGNTSAIIKVPTLRLTYKTENPVKIVIYRWSAAQQNYYQVTSITSPLLNDTTTDSVTFQDIKSDAQILGNNLLYTTGGVVENIAAPACSAMDLFDDRLWLIDAENQDVVWFSKTVIQSEPVEMSDLFTRYISPTAGAQGNTGPLRCLAPMDDKNILFKKNAIYYINGTGPDNTGANNQYSQPTFITSTVGSDNQNSIVFTPKGLMFQSDKGIWLLGRDLSTSYIGAPVEAYNDFRVKAAVAVPGTNQVRFTLDNGITLMYDYYYDQWGEFFGIPGISSTLYEDLHTYIDEDGKVFQETPGLYLDGSNPVLMGFKTAWIKLAGLQGYQRAYFFQLLGTYLSPHKLSLSIAYDYSPSAIQNVLISPQNYVGTWGEGPTWGLPSPWGGDSLEQWKVNLQKQQCESFQITFQEIFDASYGVQAGAGVSLSGINCLVGLKKGAKPIKRANQAG